LGGKENTVFPDDLLAGDLEPHHQKVKKLDEEEVE
jgi:hypothetical protein